MNLPSDSELIDFVYDEAALLDAHRHDEWLALFTDDGYYWMPLAPGQTDARLHASLLYEDTLLLKVRIERLQGQRTFSQHPQSRCHHLLQRPSVIERERQDGVHVVRTAFHFVEWRQDVQTLYAGWTRHELVRDAEGRLRIRLKRVDLLNCDGALGNMQLFI